MKPPPRRKIVVWVIEAWGQLSEELIIHSFKTCALNLAIDGSEDDQIHCFKEQGACPDGAVKIEELLQIIEEEASSFNPFDNISESDVEDASQPFQLVDTDHNSDEDIEI